MLDIENLLLRIDLQLRHMDHTKFFQLMVLHLQNQMDNHMLYFRLL
nr:MAG TPA: hypothetical protein [Bacteriophage sp.]